MCEREKIAKKTVTFKHKRIVQHLLHHKKPDGRLPLHNLFGLSIQSPMQRLNFFFWVDLFLLFLSKLLLQGTSEQNPVGLALSEERDKIFCRKFS
jgi:hypothetical protein